MKSIVTLLGAALLCGSLAVQAQTTPPPASPQATPPASSARGERPQLTPEQKAKFRADMKAAHEACKTASDKRACMTENICSKQADPAKCKEHAAKRAEHHGKRMDQHQAMAEACTGKRGDALKQCYKAEHEKRKAANPAATPAK